MNYAYVIIDVETGEPVCRGPNRYHVMPHWQCTTCSDADTEQEARDEATAWYIEQLQRGEIEFFVEKINKGKYKVWRTNSKGQTVEITDVFLEKAQEILDN